MYPGKRVIFWYWNPVVNSDPIDKVKQSGAELWSFNPEDCKKYGRRYYSKFYMREKLLEPVEMGKRARMFYMLVRTKTDHGSYTCLNKNSKKMVFPFTIILFSITNRRAVSFLNIKNS